MIFWVTYSISSNNNNYLASYIFNKSNMIWEAYSGLGLLDSVKLVDGPHLMEKLVALQQSSFENYEAKWQKFWRPELAPMKSKFIPCAAPVLFFLLAYQPVLPHGLIRVIFLKNYTTNNYNYLSHALSSIEYSNT